MTAQFHEGDLAYEWVILFLVRLPSVLGALAYISLRHKKACGAAPASSWSTLPTHAASSAFFSGKQCHRSPGLVSHFVPKSNWATLNDHF
jgi:hypothetical protein